MAYPVNGNKTELTRAWHLCTSFTRHLLKRIGHDRLTVSAGYMAYVTLLSLVPLVTVLLTALSAFPGFAGMGEKLQKFVIENFVPAAGEVVSEYLHQFVANAGKMTAIGVFFLFVVALMLISAVDQSLNYIWRCKQKRPAVTSFSLYWMVLTLGPVLVGTSLAMSSYVTSLSILQNEMITGMQSSLLRLMPFILTTFAFYGLYTLVPNCPVRWRHALAGALTAALLFELSKKLFAMYVTHFPSYQLIYGALAVIPILFVWVYFSWCIVLLGAEVTATLGEIQDEARQDDQLSELLGHDDLNAPQAVQHDENTQMHDKELEK